MMTEMTKQELIDYIATTKSQQRQARQLGLREFVISTARCIREAKAELRDRGVIVR